MKKQKDQKELTFDKKVKAFLLKHPKINEFSEAFKSIFIQASSEIKKNNIEIIELNTIIDTCDTILNNMRDGEMGRSQASVLLREQVKSIKQVAVNELKKLQLDENLDVEVLLSNLLDQFLNGKNKQVSET